MHGCCIIFVLMISSKSFVMYISIPIYGTAPLKLTLKHHHMIKMSHAKWTQVCYLRKKVSHLSETKYVFFISPAQNTVSNSGRLCHDTSRDGFSEQLPASSACWPTHNQDMGNIVGKQSFRRTDRLLRKGCRRHRACLVSCPFVSTSLAFDVHPSESSGVSASLVCCLTYRATL